MEHGENTGNLILVRMWPPCTIGNIGFRGFAADSKNNQQHNVTSSKKRTGDLCGFSLMYSWF